VGDGQAEYPSGIIQGNEKEWAFCVLRQMPKEFGFKSVFQNQTLNPVQA
jgi:hypothetical protein